MLTVAVFYTSTMMFFNAVVFSAQCLLALHMLRPCLSVCHVGRRWFVKRLNLNVTSYRQCHVVAQWLLFWCQRPLWNTNASRKRRCQIQIWWEKFAALNK